MNILKLIGRTEPLFEADIRDNENLLSEAVRASSFLVIGGAGSIGQAVTKEIFLRNSRKLHVVDINENNLVELVRDIRSSYGYISGDFKTFAIDSGSPEFDFMFETEGPYDYVLNLSALKHVRSEKDPYTLMRMIEVNILNTLKSIELAISSGAKKYFCVSTDKAANPVNMMGASKRIMEMFLIQKGSDISISTARFANVAFSDGSLLHGFNQRILKKQPIAAPNDVRRYFVTQKEAGLLCLISIILGNNRDIVFPKLNDKLNLITLSSIAEMFLRDQGYEPYLCSSEEESRNFFIQNPKSKIQNLKQWPCYFSPSDTTGEKDFEEFFTEGEDVDLNRFIDIGVVKNTATLNKALLEEFLADIHEMKRKKTWNKQGIVDLFLKLLPNLDYEDKGRYLDSKM
jgi:FlaA1/EpsC-like NDP-sugar epimerase